MLLGIKELDNYYYGTDKKEEAVRDIINNIKGVTLYENHAVLLYGDTDNKLRDKYAQIDNISQSTSLR